LNGDAAGNRHRKTGDNSLHWHVRSLFRVAWIILRAGCWASTF
jgi:hypothetical protein